MKHAALLNRLHQHQEDALAIMRDAEPMLTDPARRDIAQLARARWALMRVLTAYQLFKHGQVFDPTVSGRLLGDAARAARMKEACAAMGEAFRDHVTRWSSSDVAGEWEVYRPAALGMIAKLRAHITRERSEITTLLDRAA